VRAGRDLHVIDGLTVTKMSNEGGDYATVLGTLCIASGQHTWNVYINHVEDSNLFIGVTVGGHDLNADPQEMKSRTYYLSNGTIRVAGKLVTRCAEPYAEGDLVTVQLDMELHHISFYKNGMLQGAGDGLPGVETGNVPCVSIVYLAAYAGCYCSCAATQVLGGFGQCLLCCHLYSTM
jgi:hypothetical protein